MAKSCFLSRALFIALAACALASPRFPCAAEKPVEPGARLVGTVVDSNGEPVAGARVSAHSLPDANSGNYAASITQALTDEQGRFELKNVIVEEIDAGWKPCTLFVRADGFADLMQRCDLDSGSEIEALTLRLESANEIKGRVIDGAGKPVGGARVAFRNWALASSPPVFTDPDGAFTLGRVPSFIFFLKVDKEGYEKATIESPKVGGDVPVEIVLVRPPTVTGVVTDAATGKPIEGASVYYMRLEKPIRTDAKGRYTFKDLGEGEHRLTALSPGLAANKLVTVTLQDDEATVVDFALEPAKAIRGLVVDSRTGQPVAGVHIDVGIEFTKAELAGPTDRTISIAGRGRFLIPEGLSMEEGARGTAYSPFATTSDEKGEFAIPISFPEMAALYFHPAEHLDHEIKLGGADLSTPLRVELDEGRIVAGRVLDPDGNPAAGVTVMCGIGNLGVERTTDAQGRFRFSALFANVYAVAAIDKENARGDVAAGGFAERRVVDDVELKLMDAGYISGALIGENDEHPNEFDVRFRREDGDGPRWRRLYDISGKVYDFVEEHLGADVQPDAGGRYTSGPLLPGTYKVHAWRRKGPKIEAKTATVAPGQTVHDVNF